jgi:hypothetical protein
MGNRFTVRAEDEWGTKKFGDFLVTLRMNCVAIPVNIEEKPSDEDVVEFIIEVISDEVGFAELHDIEQLPSEDDMTPRYDEFELE